MKTLGRIALEAYETAWGREPVEHLPDFKCPGFDAAAQAVRQAVIEECAAACEMLVHPRWPNDDASEQVKLCARLIRGLNLKNKSESQTQADSQMKQEGI